MENLIPIEPSIHHLPPSEIVQLWKDQEYRETAALAGLRLPESPVGVVELTDAELKQSIQAAAVCSEYGSISTTWCDNPKVC